MFSKGSFAQLLNIARVVTISSDNTSILCIFFVFNDSRTKQMPDYCFASKNLTEPYKLAVPLLCKKIAGENTKILCHGRKRIKL
jgi:hypothetical protein